MMEKLMQSPGGTGLDRSVDFSAAHVIKLFDDMAKTYGAVNLISSLGFSHIWRKACIRSLDIMPDHACADFMCGMGEATRLMLKKAGSDLSVDAVDFCSEMTERCKDTVHREQAKHARVTTSNVFDLSPNPIYDRICCSFGLKTLDDSQLRHFARLIGSLLKPAGRAAFVEIHVPDNILLRVPFLFYVRYIIPFLGRLCLGNSKCYRYLARYTEDYANRDFIVDYLKEVGFEVKVHYLFFGCARLYVATLK